MTNAFMHTSYIQKYFENNASGSGQRYTLSNDTISNIPILLPSLEKQHKIGAILSNIDRKIELNKAVNYHLSSTPTTAFGMINKASTGTYDVKSSVLS